MSVINSQPLIGASGNQGAAYNLERSLRFRSSASAFLNRTPSLSNRKTWTYSFWAKLGNIAANKCFMEAGVSGLDTYTLIWVESNGSFRITQDEGAGGTLLLASSALHRDPSAWYHFIVAVDTTQATDTNRVKMYVNGVQITSFSTTTYPTQNRDTYINSIFQHRIGTRVRGTGMEYDGYMTEVNFIDGQALTPSDFGETDTITGVWKPKRYTGTYGTNGFYLKFNNLTSTSTLGNDFSGNSNTWTVNNVSLTAGATYDSMTDVPTLTSATAANYAVLNPINVDPANPSGTITNGNLNVSNTTSQALSYATIGFTSSKYYYEYTVTTLPSTVTAFVGVGASPYGASTLRAYRYDTGEYFNGTAWAAYGATWTANDVIGIAIDMTGQTIEFFKNGTSQGQKTSIGLTGTTVFPLFYMNGNNAAANVNFGQRPFAYTPPSGFVALNTFNLPDSTIVAGNKVMDATLFTSTGTTQTVTNAGGFKPDLIWTKVRGATFNHYLVDTNRGLANNLNSDLTIAEVSYPQFVTTANSNGFTLGTSNYANGNSVVGWQWQAGQGTTSSNTAGSITSTVSANTSAGFSVVTCTTPASGTFTVGHGLGVAPSFVITKGRTTAGYTWNVYHRSAGAGGLLVLNSSNAFSSNTGVWQNTNPTSTLFYGNSSNWGGSEPYVLYCWAEVAGFSKFGSYTGNGSTDGVFVYTGFRPKWIMFKRTDSGAGWLMLDSARNTFNVMNNQLYANAADAESGGATADFLSNGIKIRETGGGTNASGGTYVYAAFAENPFKNSLAR